MPKSHRIIAIVLVLIVAGLFSAAIFNQIGRNTERMIASKNFQPSDFIEKEYEITEVWQREIKKENMPTFDQKYIYFKVKNQPFSFNFGFQYTDFGKSNDKADALVAYLKTGEKVKILANKKDLEYASQTGFIRTISNFLTGSNNEVEVYGVSLNGVQIVQQDIHQPTSSNRSFADIAIEHNVLKLILVSCALYGMSSWIPKLIRYIKHKKGLA